MRLINYARKAANLLRLSIRLSICGTVTPDIFDNRPSTYAGPNRNYLKFIILAHARSGSSLVIRSLSRHDQVVGFGELFVRERIGFNVEGYDNFSVRLLKARKKYPIQFLDRYIFSAYQDKKLAVGFKLFPDQLDNKHYRCVWDWINQNQDLAIVLLSRQNRLATYTSLRVAIQTGVFGISEKSQRLNTKVTIDADDLLAEFRKRERYEVDVKERTANHRVLEMTYEELSEDPRARIQDIQRFLGLDPLDPSIQFIKQEVRPLREVINNYYELKERFANTKWKSYFEEK